MSFSLALWTIRSISLDLDAGFLDQRVPLLDLGLLMRGERRGGLLFGWRNLLAQIEQALAHRGIGHRGASGCAELVDRLLRRALRNPQAVPCRDVDAGRAGFVPSRNVGRGVKPLVGCDRIAL